MPAWYCDDCYHSCDTSSTDSQRKCSCGTAMRSISDEELYLLWWDRAEAKSNKLQAVLRDLRGHAEVSWEVVTRAMVRQGLDPKDL